MRDISTRAPHSVAIRSAASCASDPSCAVAEIRDAIAQDDMAFVVFFTSPEHDRDQLGIALENAFPGIPIVGCTTAGEITPEGYSDGSLVAASFSGQHFRMVCEVFSDLADCSLGDCSTTAARLRGAASTRPGWNRFALLFADGMSLKEDALVAALDAGLAGLPLFGGSAGDGMCFGTTFVYHDGRFHSNAALLMLVETDYDVSPLSFDHFRPTNSRMVVTEARPEERIVCEINGEPATVEYARIIGQPVEALGPYLFAAHPTLVRAGGRYHVRAIQSVVNGTCLRFLSAIDTGLVLTIGEAQEIVGRMTREFDALNQSRGRPELVLGFDCILRRIEIVSTGRRGDVSRILSDNNVIGFNTYGEQHHGMHVNQTFVGVAFHPGDGTGPPR